MKNAEKKAYLDTPSQQQPEELKVLGVVQPVVPQDVSDLDESFDFSSEDELPPGQTTTLPLNSRVLPSSQEPVLSPFMQSGTKDQPVKSSSQKKPSSIQVHTVMSFDAFIESISSDKSTPVPTPKAVKQKPDRNSGLKQAKEEALKRERELQRRKSAIVKIQHWYRYRIAPKVRRSFKKFRALVLALFSKSIATTVSESARYKRTQQLLILSKYENACAAMIQRVWRRYMLQKASRKFLKQLKESLKAYLLGWKTRRVLQSWPVQDCVSKLRSSSPSTRSWCVTELLQVFSNEFRCGRWMRKRKETRTNAFLRKNQEPEKPRKSENTSMPPVRYSSPGGFKREIETSNIVDQTALPKRLQVVKPFLKRKSRKVIDKKKLDFTKVTTKVSCWVDLKALKREKELTDLERKAAVLNFLKRNSLEEFVALEKRNLAKNLRGRYMQKLPIPFSEVTQRSSSQQPQRRRTILEALDNLSPKIHLSHFSVQPTGNLQVSLQRLEPKDSQSDNEDVDDEEV